MTSSCPISLAHGGEGGHQRERRGRQSTLLTLEGGKGVRREIGDAVNWEGRDRLRTRPDPRFSNVRVPRNHLGNLVNIQALIP